MGAPVDARLPRHNADVTLSSLAAPPHSPLCPWQYTIGWTMWYLLEAIPLGVVGGALAMVMLVLRGATAKLVENVHTRLPASLILLPAIGGLLFGLVAMAAPMTIGDGSLPLSSISGDGYEAYWSRTAAALVASHCGPSACAGNSTAARQALSVAQLQTKVDINTMQYADALTPGWLNPSTGDRTYSAALIAGTMFLKMVAWAICQACGLVGGIMFPFFFVGTCAGNLAAQLCVEG